MRTFLYIPGKYSKVMIEVGLQQYNFPWHLANPDMPHPRDGGHKNDAKDFSPLAIFGTMVDNPVLDASTETGLPRRIGANVKSLYALFLDYDNGMSVDEFITSHKDLQYSLYTSYSHGSKESDRFRVVVPLSQELPCDLLESKRVRDNLAKNFEGVDECCFHRGHLQLLPLVNPEFRHLYRWHRNAGKPWEFDLGTYQRWAAEEERERLERFSAARANSDDESQERVRNFTVKTLQEIPVGSGVRYEQTMSIMGWAKRNGIGELAFTIDCPWHDVKWLRRWPSIIKWASTL